MISSSPNIPRLPEPTPNNEIEAPTEPAPTETKTGKPEPNSPIIPKPARKSQRFNAGQPPARYPDNKSEPKKEEP